MYMKLKNVEKAREQLARMRQWAQDEKNPETDKDLLTTEANFLLHIRQPDKGDQAINQLIALISTTTTTTRPTNATRQ